MERVKAEAGAPLSARASARLDMRRLNKTCCCNTHMLEAIFAWAQRFGRLRCRGRLGRLHACQGLQAVKCMQGLLSRTNGLTMKLWAHSGARRARLLDGRYVFEIPEAVERFAGQPLLRELITGPAC
eukprot:365314-Chlamydomonas_euryale.AAC.7